MTSHSRYSDACLNDSVHAVVLFDAPVTFSPADVIGALNERYKDAGWITETTEALDTAAPILAGIAGRSGGQNVEIGFSSVPGPLQADLSVPVKRSTLFSGAAEAVNRHKSYLCVTATPPGRDKRDRFIAAAEVTKIAALFAENQSCLGVYFPSADLISAPEDWVKAAAVAAMDEWPLESWISFHISRVHDSEAQPPEYSCGSIGLVSFTGQEVSFPLAPVDATLAVKQVFGACYLLLKNDSPLVDGEFIEMSDTDDPRHILIRHLSEGAFGAQSDTWLLIHPDSALTRDANFGTAQVPERSGLPKSGTKASTKLM